MRLRLGHAVGAGPRPSRACRTRGSRGASLTRPSGERLANAIAWGNSEDESGRVLVRLSRNEVQPTIATQTPGHFERVLWVDEERMVVGYFEEEKGGVDLLNLDGTRSPSGEGHLIGLLRRAAVAAVCRRRSRDRGKS